MTPLDSLLLDLSDRGYTLHYLRGSALRWEAYVTRPLPDPPINGLRFAVGFSSASDPATALAGALDRVESDFEIQTTTFSEPTCEPASPPTFDLASVLANLRSPGPSIPRRKL